MEKSWLIENMNSIMWVIGVIGFLMVAAMFLFYFNIRHNINKKNKE